MSNQIQKKSFGHHDSSIYFQTSASSCHLLQFQYLSALGQLIYTTKNNIQNDSFWIQRIGYILPIKWVSLSKPVS